jgi:hypothetical protein
VLPCARPALEHDVPKAVAAPVRRRLVVMVFVDRLDVAVARAMQFGRALRPDELRAVHFVIDQDHADRLAADWREHGLANLALELIDCPDRRLARSAVETVAHELSSGESEVCVLLPERMFNGVWHRILHDQTAESLAREISRLPHANVTTVPFHFDDRATALHTNGNGAAKTKGKRKLEGELATVSTAPPVAREDGTTPIADVGWRSRVKVCGRIQALRVEPLAGSPSLECTLVDDTGGVSLVFFGRPAIPGLEIGVSVTAEGVAIDHHGRLAIVNPTYELR